MNKPKFIGLDTEYQTAEGKLRKRIHMDGAASPLAAEAALTGAYKLLPHYSNTHSYVHSSAHISSNALHWASNLTLEFLGADPDVYTSIYNGSGATAAINRVARGLTKLRPDRGIVLVSAMEHHANDLPHRENAKEVVYFPLHGEDTNQGCVDLKMLETLLKKHRDKVNYVAVSMVSNVTGIINSIAEIAQISHKYGALVIVDGAQAVAHLELQLSQSDPTKEVDFFVFSGHKLYAPGSPGVLIAKKVALKQMDGQDLGGGSVADVSYHDYQLSSSFPDREQSGTPNIIGAVSLAAVLQCLIRYGKDKVFQHSSALTAYLFARLSEASDITVYGDKNAKRIGAIAFNHRSIDHGLLAAILNDYYAIAVRNECFCAHPYVSSMLKSELWQIDLDGIPEDQQQAFINRKRGMVRVSLSLYNSKSDIDYLVESIREIQTKFANFEENYEALPDGSYRHTSFRLKWQDYVDF